MQNSRQQQHYKDSSPEATIERLIGILREMHLEVEEHWVPQSSVGTFSLRVTAKGTDFGTNGKGVTKEYARASAYAEFFERYQNQWFDLSCIIGEIDDKHDFFHCWDEKRFSPIELASIDSVFMQNFFSAVGLNDASLLQKASFLASEVKSEYYFHGQDAGFEVRPYYNVSRKNIEYVPFSLSTSYYGSNGMCAGNTPEEAICQGLSEILERYVQTQAMKKGLTFPDVPEDVVKQYPYVYEMYCKAQALEGYHVKLKDCSMNGKYPVAALVICEENTGAWSVKFGAHPDFGIAMERTLTEAAQGVDVGTYASNSVLDFRNTKTDDDVNIFNSFKCGIAMYPYQLLSSNSEFEPWIPEDVSELTNSQILRRMIALIESEGFEVLIRDVSYTGFPSFHVIVPGMSEICHLDKLKLRAMNTQAYLMEFLNDPKRLDQKTVKYLSGVLEYFSESQIENTLRNIFSYARKAKTFPAENIGCGWLYLDAMCYVYLKDYLKAEQCMALLLNKIEIIHNKLNTDISGLTEQTALYRGMMYYFQAMTVMESHESAMEYIRIAFSEDIANTIDDLFYNTEMVFVKQYPEHSIKDEMHQSGAAKCCDYMKVLEYSQKLKQAQLENPIDQMHLAELV